MILSRSYTNISSQPGREISLRNSSIIPTLTVELATTMNQLNVLRIAVQMVEERGITATSHDTAADREMAKYIVELLDNHAGEDGIFVEVSNGLDILENELEGTDEADTSIAVDWNESGKESENSDTDYADEPNQPKASFEYRKKAVEYWENKGGQKRRKFQSVKHRYKLVSSEGQLRVWKQQLENNTGLPRSEFKKCLYEQLFAQFVDARETRRSVHDNDLKDWALRIASDLGNSSFKASHEWLRNFKKAHRIGRRKITKFVSKQYSRDSTTIATRVDSFLKDASSKIQCFPSTAIYNADQSGFEKELRSKHTLAPKGSKHVESFAQSVHSLTHSYTIMPIINMDGMLLPKLYICLQETRGTFGPRVRESMFKPRNLVMDASSSGKMTKQNLECFYRDVYFPHVEDNSLLLVDSWSGYTDKQVLESTTPPEKNVEVLQIPPGTTGRLQPLDREFFRQWKNLCRQITEKVVAEKTTAYDVFTRDSILKLQSFAHYQFSSPRFRNLIRYAWYATKYTEERPPSFVTPAEFCMKKTQQSCQRPDCNSNALFRCAWCKSSICLAHGLESSHFCDEYIE